MRERTPSSERLELAALTLGGRYVTMAVQDQQLVMNVFAFFMNVSTSVVIVFVNKFLMRENGGMGFHYATTLCALHYLVCTLSMWTSQGMGLVKRVDIPFSDLVIFTAAANVSIVSLNLSLMLNSVGFYQIAKLLIIPFVCLVEYVWLGRRFSTSVVAAVLTVVVGVAVVTVTNVEYRSALGLAIAALSVVSSGMQQILCRTVQQKNKVASHELLAKTAPAQGVSLLLVGPFLDRYLTGDWVARYEYSVPAMAWLAASCAVAVLVNVSQFMCLGRFSAVTFQVLGHAKTVLVLFGGWALFADVVTLKQLAGICIAVAGMVWYGAESSKAGPAPSTQAPKKAKSPEEEGLLLVPAADEKKETV